MGQEEVLEFLKEHPNEWFNAREILESLPNISTSVSYSLKQLRKGGFVLFKGRGKTGDEYQYKFKD